MSNRATERAIHQWRAELCEAELISAIAPAWQSSALQICRAVHGERGKRWWIERSVAR